MPNLDELNSKETWWNFSQGFYISDDLFTSLNFLPQNWNLRDFFKKNLSAEDVILLKEAKQQLAQPFSKDQKSRIAAWNLVNYVKSIAFFDEFLGPYPLSEGIYKLLFPIFISPAGLPYELEDENALLKSIFPRVARVLSCHFEFSETGLKEAFDEILPELREKYPLAKKSLDFSLQSQKQKKEGIEEIKNVFYDKLLSHFQKEINSEQDIETNVEIFIAIVNDVYDNIEEIYSLLFQELWKEKFYESHTRRKTQQENSQKLPVNKQTSIKKEPETNLDKIFWSVTLDPHLHELIKRGVDALTLSDWAKEKLIARLIRWTKNKKDVKMSDYFWETPIVCIVPEERDQFSSLIKSLGLHILEMPSNEILLSEQKSEQEIEKNEGEAGLDKVEGNDISTLKRELLLPELKDIDGVIDFSLQQLSKCGYSIENEKKLAKQFKEFCVNEDHTTEIRNFFSDLTRLKTLEKKKKGEVYSLSNSSKYGVLRLLLTKTTSWYEVDSFFSNHDDYEKRIDYLAR